MPGEKAQVMQYWILIFNQKRLDGLNETGLVSALEGANLTKLCMQFGLDDALIAPAVAHLQLLTAPARAVPFSALHYQSEGHHPVFIHCWDIRRDDGAAMLAAFLHKSTYSALAARLKTVQQIWGVELSPNQLEDMGLVFAYEIARFMVAEGGGLVRGLDGVWYRLNRHEAFIPLQDYPPCKP